MNRYLISDTHFGHANIIKYEKRPFQNVEEMNATIIKNWNKVVSKNDIVYFLGDLSFSSKGLTEFCVEKLNGRKMMVTGNHDTRSVKFYQDAGFEFVSKYPIIVDDFYILSHEPVYLSESMPYVNIHGHLHNKTVSGNYFNVSVEKIDYTPINFNKIKERFKSE